MHGLCDVRGCLELAYIGVVYYEQSARFDLCEGHGKQKVKYNETHNVFFVDPDHGPRGLLCGCPLCKKKGAEPAFSPT